MDEVPNEAVLQRQVNRSQLQEIIAGLGEGVLLIDSDDRIVWANEQALALHNVSDLSQLGISASGYRRQFLLRYRNHHKLKENQYPIDRLLNGETFEDVIVEVTKNSPGDGEDPLCGIHSLRGVILRDHGGNPESYALVIEDLTEQFTAEERFERTFASNPAPAAICKLSDLRYIKVNQGFLELSGYDREDVLGRTIYEIDILENAASKGEAIAALREGQTIPQTEATLRLSDGDSKLVIVAGQPIEVSEEPCMLFTFMDLEPRRKAEDALRQSEERFARSFRLTPTPTVLFSRDDFRVLDVNDAFAALVGLTSAEIVDNRLPELPVWISTASRRHVERKITELRSFNDLEFQLKTRLDATLDCLVSAETLVLRGKECVLMVIQDITERKRSETELIAAIEAVMKDASWFSRSILDKLANIRHTGSVDTPAPELSDFTPRELEILGLMCQGLNDTRIAEALKLSRNTVRNHTARIYSKAEVHSRAAAIVWARERGFTGASVDDKVRFPGSPT
ncbi:helix-turn-helix transcriptional regulator [Paracoccus alkanivorans]|uniref:PAS domain S-box protein n=1 Tax=Paracoccus alkanivorans TaxID=2116655 RepID=A0A3M0MHM7_9RHOB|nr:helix-turn-helix transcriptional regulator [Paracoccus alkanivorans]RMC37226.1 PAS domain S-box protein [Paracoccus alkanivorans]